MNPLFSTQPAIRRSLTYTLLSATLAVAAYFALPHAASAQGSYAQGRFDSKNSEKVFRYAFEVAETGFDPAQISDLYSRIVASSIFETLFTWDWLADPPKVVPNLAEGPMTPSNDFKTFTVKIKKGVLFQDNPAFGGKPREATADDFVYSLKRHFDPKYKSYGLSALEQFKLVGMAALRDKAIKEKKPFEYDQVVEGVKALDRYTIQFNLKESAPRFAETFTDASLFGFMAREVVEKYPDSTMENPVGTGPYRLAAWRRASKIVLEKNPTYRERYFDGNPSATDTNAQEILQRLKGKRLPMNDRVEISILTEDQPRWLAFLNNEHDFLERLPNSFAPVAIPNNVLANNLAKQGIKMYRTPLTDMTISFFNMEDPVVGGYTDEKVALRRAISLAIDVDAEIKLARRGQAIKANILQPPGTYGFDRTMRTIMNEHSPAKAKALLDLYGYVDRDGDGFRDMPDGSKLVISCLTQTDARTRELDELMQKQVAAVGIKINFVPAKWPDNLKKARAGNLQMWRLGYSAGGTDPDDFVMQAYGPAKGENNLSRFDRPEYNALYEKQHALPDGPERLKTILDAHKMIIAYAPIKTHTHRVATDMMHPWARNYRRHPFLREFFMFVEVDPQARVKALGDN
jgi:ABC-type transport system substrate-binding protein